MTTEQRTITADYYDRDYYAAGKRTGKGNYESYGPQSLPHWAGPLARFLAQRTPGPVLDLGCCFGHLVRELSNLHVTAYGIDWSPYATTNSVAPGRVLRMDGKALLFRDGAFGSVVSLDYLEHHAMFEVLTALGESVRVLRPGGLALHLIGIDAAAGEPGPSTGHGGDRSHQWSASLGWYREQFERLGLVTDEALCAELNAVPAWTATDWNGRWWAGRKAAS